jgi:hypothetical protein
MQAAVTAAPINDEKDNKPTVKLEGPSISAVIDTRFASVSPFEYSSAKRIEFFI